MKPVIYIASPYTKGDPAINTRCQLAAFDELMNDGLVWPLAPLTSHFIHILFPRNYQDWVDYDLALIERCDACLRLDAEHPATGYSVSESKGADGEVVRFRELGKPVFYCKEALYAWVRRCSTSNGSSSLPASTNHSPIEAHAEIPSKRTCEQSCPDDLQTSDPMWGFEVSTSPPHVAVKRELSEAAR